MALDDALTKEGARYNGRHANVQITLHWNGLIADDTDPMAVLQLLSRQVSSVLWKLPGAPIIVSGQVSTNDRG